MSTKMTINIDDRRPAPENTVGKPCAHCEPLCYSDDGRLCSDDCHKPICSGFCGISNICEDCLNCNRVDGIWPNHHPCPCKAHAPNYCERKARRLAGKVVIDDRRPLPAEIYASTTWVNATGDVVRGDTIRFQEAVFGGSYRKPRHLGDRDVVAHVVNDSYGQKKQQHTFTLRILSSAGTQALENGVITTRKGRNVYRNVTERLKWIDESARKQAADEKHKRGDVARRARAERKAMWCSENSLMI